MSKEIENEARRLQDLAYSVKSIDGARVVAEIEKMLIDLQGRLTGIACQTIPFPHEYSRNDLDKLKLFRAKIESLKALKEFLNFESLLVESDRLFNMAKGETPAEY